MEKILIVDDNIDIAELESYILSKIEDFIILSY